MADDELDTPRQEGPTKQRVGPAERQRLAREGPNSIRSEQVSLVLVEVDYKGDDPPLDEGDPDDAVAVDEVALVFVTHDHSEDPPSFDEGGDDSEDPDVLVSVDAVTLASLELDTSEDPTEDD